MGDTFSQTKNKQEALQSLMCCLIFLITHLVCIYMSPSNIVQTHQIYIIYCLGFAFCKITLHLSLAHITEDKFDQWRLSFLAICFVLILNTVIGYTTDFVLISEDKLIIILFLISTVAYFHMAVCVSLHLSNILAIKIFKIQKKEEFQLVNELPGMTKQVSLEANCNE